MKQIWAPWRIEYIEKGKTPGCVLCDAPKANRDPEKYILYRGRRSFIMLNSYPYNPGHLMIAPYEHVATIEALDDETLLEHWQLGRLALKVLREAYRPQGFNIGVNLGKAAGAGIDDHVHTHIVPRWGGDTNFMTVMADAKVIPEALAESYNKLKGLFAAGQTR